MEDFISTEYNFFLEGLGQNDMQNPYGTLPSENFLNPQQVATEEQNVPNGENLPTGFMVQVANANPYTQ